MNGRKTPVCICLTGRTISEDLSILDEQRSYVDMVELRADFLDPSEKLNIRDFPEKAGLPCILTVRRRCDGGNFTDGEGARLVMMAKAISFAKKDSKANFAYIDLEDDFHVDTLEEACRTFGTRIIRSHHYLDGVPENLDEIWENLSEEDDVVPKLAVSPPDSTELARFLQWSATLPDREKILMVMGEVGVPARILAGRLGSMLTFASVPSSGATRAAPGQLSPQVLSTIYRSHEVDDKSDCYVLLGAKSIIGSMSPFLHSRAFRDAGKDALMVPLPSDSIKAALENMRFFGAKGAAVTVPFKEEVLPFLTFQSVDVQHIGACNTLIFRDDGLAGYNTDADGFERSALEFLNRADFRGMKVTLLGAGGAAKSVALALYRKGAECIILNRTISTARALARKYGFRWGPLDDRAMDLIAEYSDLIVQATSIGMQGGPGGDPLSFYEFDGHERVFDLIYNPGKTQVLKRAEAAGCQILNGYRMLCYQAAGQYRLWMGEEPPDSYFAV